MEAFSFMKFWLSNANGKPHREIRILESAVESTTTLKDHEIELYEGDDSFFELEISLSDYSLTHNKTPDEKQRHEPTISKSKVLPFIDITSKPQSPITLLKSGQKLRTFSLKKSKSVDSEKSTTVRKENSRSLNVMFKNDDEEITSVGKTPSISKPYQRNDTMFEDSSASPVSTLSSSSSSSKRFFSLIKPLYTKTTKKQSNSALSSTVTSPTSSPAAREKHRNSFPSGIRSVKRQLGKSRSASATIGVMSPVNRVDESLQVQQDGIQSAILHCKKSFHGSREFSLLSRSTSESSSQEKLSTSSSEDSYLFSRISSDLMSEKSMDSLTTIEEIREKISS